MEARNLSINNFVLVDNEKHHPQLKDIILKVVGVRKMEGIEPVTFKKNLKYAVSLETRDRWMEEFNQYLEYIKPILLTKDWMKDFGFKTTGINNEFDNGRFSMNVLTNHITGEYMFRTLSYTMKLEFVHELQNLFFSLSKSELELVNEK